MQSTADTGILSETPVLEEHIASIERMYVTFRVGAFLQTSGGGINLEKSWGCGKDGQVMGVYRQGGLKMGG